MDGQLLGQMVTLLRRGAATAPVQPAAPRRGGRC
jgi:hypothetical protein